MLLDSRAAGNRAPVGVYFHAAFLLAEPTRTQQMKDFISYALEKDNVVFATISEVGLLEGPMGCTMLSSGLHAIGHLV